MKAHQLQSLFLAFLQVHTAEDNLILRLRDLSIGFHTMFLLCCHQGYSYNYCR